MRVPDVHDPEFWRGGPDEALREFRLACPVGRHLQAGFWAVAGHDEITRISKDPATFSSAKGVLIGDRGRTVAATDSILYVDPPRHVAQRRVVNKAFTVRKVALLTPVVERIVAEVFDAIDPATPVDAVDAVSAPVPILVMAHMLGVPAEDLATFRTWSDAIAIAATDQTDPRARRAMDFFIYFNAKLDARQEDPKDDLLSVLVADSELTRAEQLGFCMTLLVAGNETTRHLISGGLLALAQHPDQRAKLVADETLIPTAVEEMLRWVTPILAMSRTTTRPVELAGRPVDRNEYVIMLYAAANRDDTVFGANAGEFDVTRSPNPHLAFGVGEHFCLGAQLARLEGRIVFTELLRRWPDYRVLDAGEMAPSTLLRECVNLPVIFSPAQVPA
jgi:cytochrome P450